MHFIQELIQQQKQGIPLGIYSCCSANEMVIKAALKRGIERDTVVLVEATANQVNQFGGYTGMDPQKFHEYVLELCKEMQFPEEKLILGGDHLGPLTWVDKPEAEAMEYASELVRCYASAGYTKIHIDTSMRVADDDQNIRLSDEIIARRAAELCVVAENAYKELLKNNSEAIAPVYIIGSEVPIPGGSQEAEDSLQVTDPKDVLQTIDTFKETFHKYDLDDAWQRIVGLVVQPGVEFGDDEVFAYDREKAELLTKTMQDQHFILEGHSTDYQTKYALREMVEDGIAILKVGPALTFAYREALIALEMIEKEILSGKNIWLSNFREILEYEMLESPENWKKHYHGTDNELKISRVFSYSDRARYYLDKAPVKESINRLFNNLSETRIPQSVLSQYMPIQYQKVHNHELSSDPSELAIDYIGLYVDDYLYATLNED